MARVALAAVALATGAGASAFAVAGLGLLRTPDELALDDGRFQAAPLRPAGLWEVDNERVLGLSDDVSYRELAALYLRVEPGRVDYQGFPELETLRAKAQFELTRRSREEGDPVRRSRLLTLYGVMTLDDRPLDKLERENMFRKAISAFRSAIELDPTNVDAKTNLEAALSVFPPIGIAGSNPTGGANQGPVSGQGATGTGY